MLEGYKFAIDKELSTMSHARISKTANKTVKILNHAMETIMDLDDNQIEDNTSFDRTTQVDKAVRDLRELIKLASLNL